jgi:hypothetical protein
MLKSSRCAEEAVLINVGLAWLSIAHGLANNYGICLIAIPFFDSSRIDALVSSLTIGDSQRISEIKISQNRTD